MGLFNKIKQAQASGPGGHYIEPGAYTLEIQYTKRGTMPNGVAFAVVSTKVVWSTNPKFEPGAQCDWMVTFDKLPAMGNIKRFLMVVGECEEHEIDEAGAELVFPDGKNGDVYKGKLIDADAYNKPTQENKPFTRVQWLPAGTLKADRERYAAAQ